MAALVEPPGARVPAGGGPMTTSSRIVIVGGGAGGLELATRLGRAAQKLPGVSILLIDKYPFHIWKPLFHEVASGSLDVDMDGVDYRAHAANNGFEFQLGTLRGLDRPSREVALEAICDQSGEVLVPPRCVNYDILVLAVGSVTNDFSVPGVREHCFTLDDTDQASRLHQRLFNAFLKVKASGAEGPLRIAIVGGGATGVELAAELYKTTDALKVYGFRSVNRNTLEVNVIEASDRLLGVLPEHISQKATKVLSKLGARIFTRVTVKAVDHEGILVDNDTRIPADVVIWCAGVKCQKVLENIDGLTTNKLHQVVVDQNLRSIDDSAIYALGDCAACTLSDGALVPPRAQTAHQMANAVCRNIVRQLKNRPLVTFAYQDHGSLVSFADYNAVGVLAGLFKNDIFVEGGIAKYLYISLYRLHQIALHGYVKTALLVLVGRINRRLRPVLKLH